MRIVKHIEEKYYDSAESFLRLLHIPIANNYQVAKISLLMKITTDPIKELFLLFITYKKYLDSWTPTLSKSYYQERIEFSYKKLEEFVKELIILKKRNYKEFYFMIERMVERRDKAYEEMQNEDDNDDCEINWWQVDD